MEKIMPVMDEFKKERNEILKNGSWKEKVNYFIYYYKWHVVIVVVLIAVILSIGTSILNHKDYAFYGLFLNSADLDEEDEQFLTDFISYASINTEEYDTTIDTSLYISQDSYDETSMSSTQKIMVYTAAGELDVMVSDTESLEQYANNETFYNLYEILTEEQIAKYSPYFYYIDQSVVDEVAQIREENDNEYLPEYPDPSKPEEMETPIPVAIYVSDSQKLNGSYAFRTDTVALGIIGNTKHLDTAIQFIEYLLSE